jgi:hypothetical protein
MKRGAFVRLLPFARIATAAGNDPLERSHPVEPALRDRPILVVRAEPFLRMGDGKLLAQGGYFQVVHETLREIPAERLRLPTPGATWKLTGRCVRLADQQIAAGFGAWLYVSRDEGRSWTGRRMRLPQTKGEVNLRAFGGHGKAVFVAHDCTSLPRLAIPDRESYPVAISRSTDLGATWDRHVMLAPPPPYTFLAGDGNHIVGLEDGTLLAALDTANHRADPKHKGWIAQVFYRSRDGGQTWGDASLVRDRAAEVGMLPMGGQHVMAAMRGVPNSELGGKTVQLADSMDGGRSWSQFRQLTSVFGQAHADIAHLPGGGVVAVYENRYPVDKPDIRARVSWDNGRTWEPELYILAEGIGYSGSVASGDGTIITVTGDGIREAGKPSGRGYTLQVIRWKPIRRP